ncbi:ABC transporter ATP-binding protein [Roseomonas haemaphysalidis]|uniref:ABC transporter ATP-binding protein n=1 Tax=Roseomonas haemaphysalidis TaxID=2768162 RepID=A0ABS3KWD5_9PROT|nr:ABC transporter ATP-binding protein [Roseomonas haemaphysalidis]MBO1081197.1 ABC transporter ATP-binding protein [Roseomonas haemaphysalidis]
MTRAAEVRFENVTKSYGGSATAVRDVSFTIPAGTLCTLLGPSGCGKTTTLRMIAGLEYPTSGRVLIGGRDVSALPPAERDVSMVFQSYALFPHMNVLENVGYGLAVSRQPKARVREAALAALESVGLSGFGERLPSELSGGQQQRVAVARALVLEPAVLLFDEPLSNLDARLRRRMREEIRDLQQRLGVTVAYVTHDQAEALAISDKIIVMNQAVIAQEGTPRDLYEQPANAFVAGFVGEANRLDATLSHREGELAKVTLGPATLTLPHRGAREGAIQLAVRPEAIALHDAADPAAMLRGTVSKAAYLGGLMEYTLATEAGDMFVIDPHTNRMRGVGEPVGISLGGKGVAVLPA